MSTRVPTEFAVGIFKKPRAERVKEKTVAPKKKRARREGNDETHAANIRQCPCCIPGCPTKPSQIHHLKSAGGRGIAMKAPDKLGVPLCFEHHLNGVEKVGSRLEMKWFLDRGIDPLELAAALWNARGDLEKMRKIVIEHRMAASG